MFILRLFRRDQPFVQLEARGLAEGEITLGRDSSADWSFGETDESVSRIHCTLAVDHGRLMLCDKSKNGVFLSDGGRAPAGDAVELQVRDSIHFGAFLLLVDRPAAELGAHHTVTIAGPALTPKDWPGAPKPAASGATAPPRREASLLQAFCDGAKLDASAFSGEDPLQMMGRLGALYQQTVLGLSTLMAARAEAKQRYQMERTTISGADNNPFKWTQTRKLAEDLLKTRADGFLSDSDAVRASFDDLILHLNAVTEGADIAATHAIEVLSPEAIQAEAKTKATLMRGQASVSWEIYKQRHAALVAETIRGASPVARAYGEAVDGSA